MTEEESLARYQQADAHFKRGELAQAHAILTALARELPDVGPINRALTRCEAAMTPDTPAPEPGQVDDLAFCRPLARGLLTVWYPRHMLVFSLSSIMTYTLVQFINAEEGVHWNRLALMILFFIAYNILFLLTYNTFRPKLQALANPPSVP